MDPDLEVISIAVSKQPFGYSAVSPDVAGFCLMGSDATELAGRLQGELQTLYLIEQRRRVRLEVVETARCGILPTKMRVRDVD